VSALVWVAAIAVALRLTYGRGYVGYDGMYTLVWGRDLGHGQVPDLHAPFAPTPHPLLTLAGVVLSPFGSGAPALFQVLVIASFAVVGWAAFELGRNLFSVPVGLVFALILLTRKLLVVETLLSSQDIPFMALVLSAAALEARERRRGMPVLVLLAAAGLIRPEAWLLSVAYLVYLLPRAPGRQRALLVAVAASAPIIWAAFDLAFTGDLLFSLHGTQTLAAQLERPRHIGTGLSAAPIYLKFILHAPIMWGGIAGCALALTALYERSLLPAALGGLGLLAFLILSITSLPLLVRYLLIPAAMLALFFAVGMLGWLSVPRGSWPRSYLLAAAPIVLLLGVLSIPGDRRGIEDAHDWIAVQRRAQAGLHDLARSDLTKRWMRRCPGPVYLPTRGVVPLLAFWLDEPLDRFSSSVQEPQRGLFIGPANPVIAATVQLEPGFGAAPPKSFDRVGGNGSWTLYARC
jgi:hypothetical protein